MALIAEVQFGEAVPLSHEGAGNSSRSHLRASRPESYRVGPRPSTTRRCSPGGPSPGGRLISGCSPGFQETAHSSWWGLRFNPRGTLLRARHERARAGLWCPNLRWTRPGSVLRRQGLTVDHWEKPTGAVLDAFLAANARPEKI